MFSLTDDATVIAMSARALALWCALVVALSAAAAYTVDCNHEYTDCETELSEYSSVCRLVASTMTLQ